MHCSLKKALHLHGESDSIPHFLLHQSHGVKSPVVKVFDLIVSYSDYSPKDG